MKTKYKVLAMFALLAVITGCSGKSLDIEKVIDIKLVGYNEAGKLEFEVNEEKIAEIIDYENLKDDEAKSVGYFFPDTIDIEVENNNSLKNGDTAKVVVTYDEEIAKKIGLSIKNTTFNYKVKGLEDIKVISIKDDIELGESGISPEISVNNAKYVGDIKYLGNHAHIVIFPDEDTPNNRRHKTGDKIPVRVIPQTPSEPADFVIKAEDFELEVQTKDTYATSINREEFDKLVPIAREYLEKGLSRVENGYTVGEFQKGYFRVPHEVLDENYDGYYGWGGDVYFIFTADIYGEEVFYQMTYKKPKANADGHIKTEDIYIDFDERKHTTLDELLKKGEDKEGFIEFDPN